MSVYTHISKTECEELLSSYNIGQLLNIEGIEAGVTNTIYHLTSVRGEYVLTIFEALKHEQLPFYIELVNYYSEHGIPTPKIINNQNGQAIQTVQNKAAIISDYLPGCHCEQITADHCYAVGDILGKMHLLAMDFPKQQGNPRGISWYHDTAESLLEKLPVADALLLQEEIGFHKTLDYNIFPKGIIHADLFPDNVLFEHGSISGILDFYYACYDNLLLDVAISVNCWCQDGDGHIIKDRMHGLLEGYQIHRKITPLEQHNWVGMLRFAALRFWLSRLHDKYYPSEGEHITQHDPDEYKRILQHISHIPKL